MRGSACDLEQQLRSQVRACPMRTDDGVLSLVVQTMAFRSPQTGLISSNASSCCALRSTLMCRSTYLMSNLGIDSTRVRLCILCVLVYCVQGFAQQRLA